MRIRTRFFLVLACFILLLTLLATFVSRQLFASRSNKLETLLMHEVLVRGVRSLESETETLRRSAGDWAGWDDTYEFVATRSQEYIDSNLVDDTFEELRINVIVFLDLEGRTVCAKALDLDTGERIDVPFHLSLHFSSSDRLWRHASPTNRIAGLLAAGGEIWQVASEPILTSEDEGPIRGALVFARLVDSRNSPLMARSPAESFLIEPMSGQRNKREMQVQVRGRSRISSHAFVEDIYGEPSIKLEVEMPRRIKSHDSVSLLLLTGTVLLCGAMVGLVAFFMVDRLVLRHLDNSIRALREGVSSVRADGDMRLHVDTSRSDEMGELARSIDSMLETLSLSRAELRVSEQKYRDLVETAPDAIVGFDTDGKILSANTAFVKLMGFDSASDVVGQPLPVVWPGAMFETLASDRREWQAWKRMVLEDMEIEGPKGSRWFSATLSRTGPPSAAHAFHGIAIIRETTERVEAEREAEARRKQLVRTQRLAALGTLVAGVAHEINNPNSVIDLNTGVLCRRLRAGDRGGQTLDDFLDLLTEIQDASRRIATIVKALRGFARPTKEGVVDGIQVNEVVLDACNLTRQYVAKKGAKLCLSLLPDMPLLPGNAQQLVQVVVNLIQNACEAIEQTDVDVKISTSFDEERRVLLLTVEDKGAGIAADERDRVFDPFFTTRRDGGGMGLGLSISVGIVEAHGGHMEVESVPGKGTKMSVILPTGRAERCP